MKLYKVALNLETVVVAESDDDAVSVAINYRNDIVSECNDDWSVVGLIYDASDLPKGWHNKAYPWGNSHSDRIEYYISMHKDEYIKSLQEEIERLNRIVCHVQHLIHIQE